MTSMPAVLQGNTIPLTPVSILMAVYHKDNPRLFDWALDSLVRQRLLAKEILLVLDGPLSPQLDFIIQKYRSTLPLRTIQLPRSVGLGEALSIGVLSCSHELIARADSDDINHVDRLALQVGFMENNPSVGAVGSWVTEFETDPDHIISERRPPITPPSLARYARSRCPLNHPSVVFRRSAVLSVGNYSQHRQSQDYHLWVRLIREGYEIANIPRFLVNMHCGNTLGEKRGGLVRLQTEVAIQKELLEWGFVSRSRMAVNILLRTALRLSPTRFRRFLYRRAWRIKGKN